MSSSRGPAKMTKTGRQKLIQYREKMSREGGEEAAEVANSVIEDPGIPLVGTQSIKYQNYTNSSSPSASTDALHPEGKPDYSGWMGGTSRAASGWNVVTGAGGGRWNNISYRLSRRKNLLFRRRILVDVACLLAFVGVGFMLVEAELFLQGFISKTDAVSVLLKLMVSGTTLLLLIAIIAYHVTGVQLIMVDNSFEDWRLVITADCVLWVCLELSACAIHPPPGDLGVVRLPAVESVLSVLMFLRLYLLARFIVVHSHLVSDASAQSLGALNKVKIDAVFVFKALMTEWPGSVLLILMAGIFFLSSWSVHACESYMTVSEAHVLPRNASIDVPGRFFSEAMWLSAITFLTVGYGDVTPRSECGRVTAVVTGLLGVGTTALMVAVLASKLEQSRAEMYVHTFVSRVRLDKAQKHAAADIIKNVLKLWRLRQAGATGAEARRRLRIHGKLLKSVRDMREAKTAKLNIGEAAVGVIEVNTAVAEVFRVTEAVSEQQNRLVARMDEMEQRLSAIEAKLDRIAEAVLR